MLSFGSHPARALVVPSAQPSLFWIASVELLRETGFVIQMQDSGESLTASSIRLRPDLVLLADWNKTYAGKIRALRETIPTEEIPILTAFEAPSLEVVAEMVEAGVSDCLRLQTPRLLAVARLRSVLEVKRRSQSRIELLQNEAQRDSLTGLWNHRCLQERLRKEFARSSPGSSPGSAPGSAVPLALLMIDIDNFKHENDTLGHLAGDQLLQGLARVLTAAARTGDTAARYGGDEFTLLLVGAPRAAAHKVARRISQDVSRGLLRRSFPSSSTISIGIAMGPEDGVTPTLLLEAADMALYQSKRLGKNRIASVAWTPFALESSQPFDFVGVGGDWNNWSAEQGALVRVSPTRWEGDLLLPMGLNRYKFKAFLGHLGRWFPDAQNPDFETDSFGGINSCVRVLPQIAAGAPFLQ